MIWPGIKPQSPGPLTNTWPIGQTSAQCFYSGAGLKPKIQNYGPYFSFNCTEFQASSQLLDKKQVFHLIIVMTHEIQFCIIVLLTFLGDRGTILRTAFHPRMKKKRRWLNFLSRPWTTFVEAESSSKGLWRYCLSLYVHPSSLWLPPPLSLSLSLSLFANSFHTFCNQKRDYIIIHKCYCLSSFCNTMTGHNGLHGISSKERSRLETVTYPAALTFWSEFVLWVSFTYINCPTKARKPCLSQE